MSNQLQKNYDALDRLQKATVAAVKKLEAEAKAFKTELAFYKAQLKNADMNVDIQKEIVANHINQSQKQETVLVKEILLLKAKVRRLGGG